jgi:hypothetical protein
MCLQNLLLTFSSLVDLELLDLVQYVSLSTYPSIS